MTVPEIAVTRPEGPGDAPLLLLGPSLGTSTILWENVLPALCARYRVAAWDLPGHGAAPAPADGFSVGELADAVAGAIGALGEQRVLYAGVSLGGATGLELAVRHPESVSAAAIIASSACFGNADAWHERAALVRAQSTSALIIGSAQRWFAPGSIEREPELTGRLLHALRETDAEGYARCCEALAGYDVRDRLAGVATPILALWGRLDQVAPETMADEIARSVPDGTVGVIEDAAHLPPAEQPVATASALLDFFAPLTEGTAR